MKKSTDKFSIIREEKGRYGIKRKILVAKKIRETQPIFVASGTASPILKRETTVEDNEGDNGDLYHCLRETHILSFNDGGAEVQ